MCQTGMTYSKSINNSFIFSICAARVVLTMPPKKGRQPTRITNKKARGNKKKVPEASPPEDVPAPDDAVPADAEEVGQEDASAPVDVPASKDVAAEDEATRSPRSLSPPPPGLEIEVDVHAPPATAGDKAVALAGDEADDKAGAETGAEDADPHTQPVVGKGRGQKGKSKEKDKPKRDFSLEVEQEERLLEWMAEHDEVWRRGHRLYKKRKEIWGAKAAELGVSTEHILGWWKSVKDWYVRLNKVKSGQAAKKYTDREQFILDNCKFYNTQLPSTVSAPMVSLQRSNPNLKVRVSESEPDSDQEQAPTPLDDLEVLESTSAEAGRASSSHSRPSTSSRLSKKRKRGEEEEEWMKDLRETMKANQKLLAQLVQEKPAQSSEREVFIKYMSDSLRAAPAEQYKQLKTHFSALLDAASQETAPAPQPARPAQAMSAPPVFQQPQQSPQSQQYQQSQQCQQQAPQYQQSPQYQQQAPHYQLFQQYQQEAPQYQQFQQSQGDQQPRQSHSYASSASAGQASGEQRLSASTFNNLLNTSQAVLDGSINLSPFSVDSQPCSGPGSNRLSTQSLNTPPAPRREKDQSEKNNDSDYE